MELNWIRQLYDYNRWADRRILAMASTLTNEDFIRPMGNSFSSVRDTLSHILGAEWIWLERWQGRSPKALLDAATFSKVQSLESRWETIKHDQTQFIEALTPQRLVEELAYLNQRGQALLVSALAADGPRGQPFQLPSGPGHYSAAPARGRSSEHGFPRVLRREAERK